MAAKGGKYAKVIDKLPRMLGAEPQYQQKVEVVKQAMTDEHGPRPASAIARDYIGAREGNGPPLTRDEVEELLYRLGKEGAEALVSEANLRLEAISQMMFDQYEAEGVTTLTVDGRAVAARLVPYANVGDKEAFRQWCLADKDLALKMALPWASTNKIAADMLAAGEEPPPGITVFAKQRFTLGGE